MKAAAKNGSDGSAALRSSDLWYRADTLETLRSQQDLDADLNAEVAEVSGGDSMAWHESEHHQRQLRDALR